MSPICLYQVLEQELQWTYASCRGNYQSTRCHWGPQEAFAEPHWASVWASGNECYDERLERAKASEVQSCSQVPPYEKIASQHFCKTKWNFARQNETGLLAARRDRAKHADVVDDETHLFRSFFVRDDNSRNTTDQKDGEETEKTAAGYTREPARNILCRVHQHHLLLQFHKTETLLGWFVHQQVRTGTHACVKTWQSSG